MGLCILTKVITTITCARNLSEKSDEAKKVITPYIEGGIDLIYTDHTVDDQSYRLNFNPQAGF